MPRLFCLDEDGGRARLYVSGLATAEALRLFPQEARIVVTLLSGLVGYGPSPAYRSQDDIPAFRNVGEAASYLEAETQLVLIDFRATVGEHATVSTHDDGEATFRVGDKAKAVALLDAALGGEGAGRAAVLDNPGRFVRIGDGETSVFETFDQALASGRLD